MESIFKVTIKESPIHELGVFADELIPKGSKISYFTGIEMSYQDVKKKYGLDWRCIYRTRPWLDQIVSKDCRNLINYVNDGVHNQEHPYFNCKLRSRWLIALCDINPGEELLLQYPESYWKYEKNKSL